MSSTTRPGSPTTANGAIRASWPASTTLRTDRRHALHPARDIDDHLSAPATAGAGHPSHTNEDT